MIKERMAETVLGKLEGLHNMDEGNVRDRETLMEDFKILNY